LIRSGQSRVAPDASAAPAGPFRALWNAFSSATQIGSHAGRTLIELEDALMRRLQRLQSAESRLSRLVHRLRGRAGRRAARQIERERQRLGRELHTGVGQLLAAIRIQVELLDSQLPAAPPAAGQTLRRISDLAGEALDQVRGVAGRLHPPDWLRLPLGPALEHLWRISGVPERYSGAITAEALPREPEPEVKALFYRAAQEALANIFRHASAARIDLTLTAAAGRLTLVVRDDGVGFDAVRLWDAPGPAGGLGLRSLREQVADLGARLAIQSGPQGTTLEISAPLGS
jgi:two-component system NarL family sensor kinase